MIAPTVSHASRVLSPWVYTSETRTQCSFERFYVKSVVINRQVNSKFPS